MFSTYSNEDYDRRNEDVDPMAASAEYELEKRVERLELFPVELEKGEPLGPGSRYIAGLTPGPPLWYQLQPWEGLKMAWAHISNLAIEPCWLPVC